MIDDSLKKSPIVFLYHEYATNALFVHINSEFKKEGIFLAESDRNALGIALKVAAARVLKIEEKEIEFCLPSEEQDCDIILYDTCVGGADYVKRVRNHFEEIFLCAIRDILIGNDEHDKTCESACPQCLVSYSSQFLFQNENNTPNRKNLLNKLNFMFIL